MNEISRYNASMSRRKGGSEARLEWAVPKTLFDEGFREEDLLALVKEQTVLELFRRRRLSAGRAAELLGIEKPEFLDLLARRRIPLPAYTTAERKRHRAALREVLRELKTEKLAHPEKAAASKTKLPRTVKRAERDRR
jgi:predicted HTH domain antitoxin